MNIKTYSELITFNSFAERFNYLKLIGQVGEETFGFDRYLNQMFYRSQEWKALRDQVIIRDNGCDLGVPGYEIQKHIIVHHMNPLTKDDIRNRTEFLLNPNYLICVSHDTHNALTYGSEKYVGFQMNERRLNDTCPWRH